MASLKDLIVMGPARFLDKLYGNLEGNATSATKLQTARAINGTNFDGSSAITTTNWGTARTLTIGSTGKSVNGSTNYSWTHAEIGATVSNTWTGGTTAGPTLSTTVNGVTGTAVAIPSASSAASGVVTIADQTFRGMKTFYGAVRGYMYNLNNNAPAFVFDKPSSHWTGIGACGENDTIFFGPCAPDGNVAGGYSWVANYNQKWKFQGDIYTTNLINATGTITSASTITGNRFVISSTVGANHIEFSRGDWNYFIAPASGKFAFVANGLGAAYANAHVLIDESGISPGQRNGTMDLGTSSYRWKNIYGNWLHLSGTTNATMTYASTNPSITFSEGGSQPVKLMYTDYDTYRAPAGLKVIGDASGAWFEVDGETYSNGFSKPSAYILSPGGGHYVTTTNTHTGYLKITLPVSWTNAMIRFTVDIYNYAAQTAATYSIGGYNYNGDPAWHQCSASCLGHWGYSKSNLAVHFGHDGSKCAIYIGSADTSWSYPQVIIRNVTVGYGQASNIANYSKGWSIGFTTSLGSYITTISNTNIGYSVNYAASAGTANSANSVAWGNVSGKPGSNFVAYYNSNTAMTTTESVSAESYIHTVGTTGGSITTATKPSGMDNAWGIIHLHLHSGNYGMQLGFGGTTGHLYQRHAYNSTTFGAWKTILDSSNYTSYTVTKTGSGASGTWGINVTGSSASCTGNAASATQLQTARTIFGRSFNGTGNVEGQVDCYGSYTATANQRYYYSALEIRENGLVGSAQSDIGYAPSIGFHWGSRIAATLLFHSDGNFYFRKQDGTSRATIDANVNGNASSASSAAYANTVLGSYTSNGGQQNPNYFGTNRVGFLMMNTTVNSNSHYKDWIIMDCYGGNDVGGGVALGVNRQQLGAYIMGSNAARTSWTRSAELYGTHNIIYSSTQPAAPCVGAIWLCPV